MCATDSILIFLPPRTTSGSVHTCTSGIPTRRGQKVLSHSRPSQSTRTQKSAIVKLCNILKCPWLLYFSGCVNFLGSESSFFFQLFKFSFYHRKTLADFLLQYVLLWYISKCMWFTLIIFTTGKNASWGEDDTKIQHSLREKIAGELLSCRYFMLFYSLGILQTSLFFECLPKTVTFAVSKSCGWFQVSTCVKFLLNSFNSA